MKFTGVCTSRLPDYALRCLSLEYAIFRLSLGPSGATYGFAVLNASFGSAVAYDEKLPTRASMAALDCGDVAICAHVNLMHL